MASLPSDSVTRVLDFVADLFVALVTTMTVPFLTHAFDALAFIMFTLSPALFFLLMIAVFLWMFNRKYIGMPG